MPGMRSTKGDGASSMIFWWRRWIEHSRSPTAHTVPWESAITWTSTWWPVGRQRSQNTVGSPNADWASRWAAATSLSSASNWSTTRIPRPPPPEDAFTSTGNWSAVTVSGSSSSSTGTPAAAIIFLDSLFEPIARTASAGWPRSGDLGVLGEESVAGVHRVRAGRGSRGDDGVGVEVVVGLGQPDPGIGLGDMRRVGIRVGINRDGAQAQIAARREHPPGDLAAIGNQYSSDRHLHHIRKTPKFDVPLIGPLAMADKHIPNTVRVSRGSITPSS